MPRNHIAEKLVDLWEPNVDEGDFVFLSKKDPETGQWSDRAFVVNDNLRREIKRWFEHNPPDEYHLYFCPLPFTAPKRRKENVKGSRYLWSDLDEVNVFRLPIKPTVYWESSPGRYQGLWLLDEFIEAKQAEDLSKDLAYTLGADKSGWDLTQVLRVPGTKNHKYPGSPSVGEPVETGETYSISDMPSESNSEETADLLQPGNLNAQEILAKYKAKIPRKALSLLLTKDVTVGKRSDILWYLENALMDAGLNPPEIFTLVKHSSWNKYRGRADEDERLRVELKKILEGRFEPEEKPPESPPGEIAALGLTVSSYSDLMGSITSDPGWLVEGFWTRESHGIVAGEPKAFKSIMTLDLAISVASGRPFLNHFPVYHSGSVLIVQNENSDWIMKDRVGKIITHKGLTGDLELEGRRLKGHFAPTLPIHFINQQGFQFRDPVHCQVVEKAIQEIEPLLVIFDPLYLMFDGDLNTSKDLSPALTWLLNIKQEYNTAVVLVHHWNKGGLKASPRGGQRMLGSTTLHGWVESAWYMKVQGSNQQSSEDKEEDDDVFVDKPSGEPISLVIEREFRGAGTYPKVESTIKMGKPGEPTYKIDLKKHVGKGHKSITPDLRQDIINVLELSSGPVSQRKLSEETGAGRKAIKAVLEELREEKIITQEAKGISLKEVNKDATSVPRGKGK